MSELYKIRCKKIKLTGLENRFEKLRNDYEGVAKQRDHTTNAQDVNSLERQLKQILEDLEEVGLERDQLQKEIQELEVNEPTAAISGALQALITLLTPISPEIVAKAYQGCTSEGRLRPVPETLERLVQQLAEMPGETEISGKKGELKPLFRFVSVLSQEKSLQSNQRQALQSWAEAQGVLPVASVPLETIETCLMIKVQPRSFNDPALGYLVSAAIAQDKDPLDPKAELIVTSVSIPDGSDLKCAPGYSQAELPHILNQLIVTCGRDHSIPLTDLTVQWFLPIELMSLPIEHWPIQIGRSQKQCNGQRCKAVLVRSYDRHFSPDYRLATGDWQKYWTRLVADLESKCSETLVYLDPATGKTTIDWNNPKVVGCKFLEHEEPHQQEELWDSLLGQGLPIALWVRQLGANQQTAKTVMKTMTKCSIAALPMYLAEQRQKALSRASEADRLKAAPLCLLFDNPFRPFPTIEYQSA